MTENNNNPPINLLKKLADSRSHIKKNPIKKDAENTYSNYDYFTPELVSKIKNEVSEIFKFICVFELKKDELGYLGQIITTDLESGELLITVLRTEKPELKATNLTQQMGAMATYTERYCVMTLLDIKDNSLDFDTGNFYENKSKPVEKNNTVHKLNDKNRVGIDSNVTYTMSTNKDSKATDKEFISVESFKKAMELAKTDNTIYNKTIKKYTLTAYQDEQLFEQFKKHNNGVN